MNSSPTKAATAFFIWYLKKPNALAEEVARWCLAKNVIVYSYFKRVYNNIVKELDAKSPDDTTPELPKHKIIEERIVLNNGRKQNRRFKWKCKKTAKSSRKMHLSAIASEFEAELDDPNNDFLTFEKRMDLYQNLCDLVI